MLRHCYCAILSTIAAHPSNSGLQTVYDRLQVSSRRGAIVYCGDVPTSFQCLWLSLPMFLNPRWSGCPAIQNVKTMDHAVLQCRGPTSWNSPPQSFRDATLTLRQFQRRLKTSLLRLAYGRDLTAHSWLSVAGAAQRLWRWVGGTISRAERAEKIFDPHLWLTWGTWNRILQFSLLQLW